MFSRQKIRPVLPIITLRKPLYELLSIDRELQVLIMNRDPGRSLEELRERIRDNGERYGVSVEIEIIDASEDAGLLKRICSLVSQAGSTGLFVPDNMHLLLKSLSEKCSDHITVQEVSSDIFPNVWDLMTRKVETISSKDTIKQAAMIMSEKKIGSLVVHDRGRVVGILTENDFVKVAAEGTAGNVPVREVMSQPVISLDRSGTIFEACEIMRKEKVKKLVIMDGNTLMGVITTTDLAKLPLKITEGLNHIMGLLRQS